jgi:hypothetical protein
MAQFSFYCAIMNAGKSSHILLMDFYVALCRRPFSKALGR